MPVEDLPQAGLLVYMGEHIAGLRHSVGEVMLISWFSVHNSFQA